MKLDLQRFAQTNYKINFSIDSNVISIVDTLGNVYNSTNLSSASIYAINKEYTFNVTMQEGYVLDTVVSNNYISNILNNSFTIKPDEAIITATVVITTKKEITKKSVDLTTLTGWNDLSAGNHNITIKAKASGYRDSVASESVVVNKAGSGETWVLNNILSGEINANANFTSNNTQYTNIELKDSKGDMEMTYSYELVYSNGNWFDTAYKTVTFETTPTGDLLTWLQLNGTKQ